MVPIHEADDVGSELIIRIRPAIHAVRRQALEPERLDLRLQFLWHIVPESGPADDPASVVLRARIDRDLHGRHLRAGLHFLSGRIAGGVA